MAFTLEAVASLPVPPEAAFEWLAEHDEWRKPPVVDVHPLTEGSLAVGSRFRNDVEMSGMTMQFEYEITVHDPPRRLAWTQVGGGGGPVTVVEGNYLIETTLGGSRFTLSNTYAANGAWALLTPLLKAMTRRGLRKAVDRVPGMIARATGPDPGA